MIKFLKKRRKLARLLNDIDKSEITKQQKLSISYVFAGSGGATVGSRGVTWPRLKKKIVSLTVWAQKKNITYISFVA